MKQTYELIDNPADLDRFATRLMRHKLIAVDLESDSMYHFREKVCLIQVGINKRNFIIDPLKIGDLSPLGPVFGDPGIRKVFHGADYDIRSLYRDYRFEINSLFDTQLASRFLGYTETGLEALIQKFFDVSLNKRYQKKDWSQRPLPAAMLDYAASDTVHLISLYRILAKGLREKKRMTWVKEECEQLSRVRPTMNNGDPLFLNFKGAGSLDRKHLAILEALLQLRRSIAEKKDRPLFKIFQNAAISKIVRHPPGSMKRLKKIRALSNIQMEMYGDAILSAVTSASKIEAENLPVYPRKHRPFLKARDQERIKVVKEWKERKGRQLGLEPALVLSKPGVNAVAQANPKTIKALKMVNEVKNWQVKAFGRELVSVLKTM